MTVRRKRRNASSGTMLAVTGGVMFAVCIGMIVMMLGIV